MAKPHGDSGAFATISSGIAHSASRSRHRSAAVTVRSSSSRRTSASCSPSNGGGMRVAGAMPSNRIGFGDQSEQPPRRGRRPARSAPAPSGDAKTSSMRHDRRARHGGLLQQRRANPACRAARTPPRACGINSSRCTTRDSFVANRGSSAHSGCPTTSHVLANSRSFPAARMNGRSFAWNDWYGTMFGCSVPIRSRHHAADQVVGGLVHHGGDAGVEQRHAHVAAAPGDVALAERRQHPHRGVQAADHIQQRHARLGRLSVPLAGDAHQAGHAPAR